MPGASTSEAEVVQIDAHGIWVFVRSAEYFLPYEHYPWFRDAKVSAVLNVEMPAIDHLHWPDLDVDLTVDMLEDPASYPLTYR